MPFIKIYSSIAQSTMLLKLVLKSKISQSTILLKFGYSIILVPHLRPILILTIKYKIKQLEKNKVMFTVIQKEKTYIKVKYKAFAHFFSTKLYFKSKKEVVYKKKKKIVKWPKCIICGYKYENYKVFKYTNEKCDKCHKKRHIF